MRSWIVTAEHETWNMLYQRQFFTAMRTTLYICCCLKKREKPSCSLFSYTISTIYIRSCDQLGAVSGWGDDRRWSRNEFIHTSKTMGSFVGNHLNLKMKSIGVFSRNISVTDLCQLSAFSTPLIYSKRYNMNAFHARV